MADLQPTENTDPVLPAQAGVEIGQSGTYIFDGYINAEEYNRDLQGKHALEVFDTMRRSDPTAHAALIVCKNPIIGANWQIEPASSDPIDIEAADFARREIFNHNIQWTDILREGLTSLDFGHAVQEVVYQATEFNGKARIGLQSVKSRKQRSILKWSTQDNQPGITQIVPNGGPIDIPRAKLVYIINEREGENYEGISLLRFAYKPWKIKDTLELINAIALEKMAIGVPILQKGQNNQTIGEPELKLAREALRKFYGNEEAYIEIPASVQIEMLDMKSSSTKDVLPTIQYQDTQIMLSVLAQFLLLGSGNSGGSRAVSADHSAMFIKALEAVARVAQQAYQLDLVNRLTDLNYSNLQNGYPKLVFSDLSDDDVAATATAVSSLMTAGALTADADVENRLRELLNLPQLSEEMYDSYAEDKEKAQQLKIQQQQQNLNPNGPGDNENVDKENEDLPEGEKENASILANARKMQSELFALLPG